MNKKTDTKTKLLNTAQQLMLKEGFHGVTVDRLIQEANVSKGSFFYHFNSKDELPAALLQRFINDQGERIRACLQSPAPKAPAQTLHYVKSITEKVGEVFQHPLDEQPGCVMAAFSYQLMSHFPALQVISQEALKGWAQAFTPLFEPLVAGGHKVQAEQLAMHFMCVLQGANVLARISGDDRPISEAITMFHELLDGL